MNWSAPQEKIEVAQPDPELVATLAKKLDVSPTIAGILVVKNLATYEQCHDFFCPDVSRMHDPYLFKDMERAVRRILDAIKNKERICIFGDFDVDGISSTALLMRFLCNLGAQCTYYIPDRFNEGYGFSYTALQAVSHEDISLIITADCGICNVEEVTKATSMGIDVIITDHHEQKERFPECYAIINPKCAHSRYPDATLAGVGVALKLCHGITKYLGHSDSLWQEYLDIAALGTAADIVPLWGENRIITRLGYEKMMKSYNIGLNALIEKKKLTGKRIDTTGIVFQLAPALNAAGRIEHAKKSVELLLTQDPVTAQRYASELVDTNSERRDIDRMITEEATKWVYEHCDLENDFAIVIGNENWHKGVIGIAAAKLSQQFHRPTVLFAFDEDGNAKGSARSIDGFNLIHALDECADVLESYGGHFAAAGMSIRKERLHTFREQFNKAARARLSPEDLIPKINADAEVTMEELTPKFFRIIDRMKPFGPGNSRPVLFCRGLHHHYPPKKVGNNHLKLYVKSKNISMDAIGFNFGHRLKDLSSAPVFSLAFTAEINEWNGMKRPQMNIKGIAL